ncbi:MAG: hypothetical protein KGV44_15155, partial [Flavobacteriaceae bacterium]|nr:hypothetical protein [Flavobacteriaceae bacterium]
MGSWGYKVTQSDTFLDVVDTFKTCYHLGDTSTEIEETILVEYAEITNEDSEMQDLIFGIAYGHWHIGTLTEKHFQQMQHIIAISMTLPNDFDKNFDFLSG